MEDVNPAEEAIKIVMCFLKKIDTYSHIFICERASSFQDVERKSVEQLGSQS